MFPSNFYTRPNFFCHIKCDLPIIKLFGVNEESCELEWIVLNEESWWTVTVYV